MKRYVNFLRKLTYILCDHNILIEEFNMKIYTHSPYNNSSANIHSYRYDLTLKFK